MKKTIIVCILCLGIVNRLYVAAAASPDGSKSPSASPCWRLRLLAFPNLHGDHERVASSGGDHRVVSFSSDIQEPVPCNAASPSSSLILKKSEAVPEAVQLPSNDVTTLHRCEVSLQEFEVKVRSIDPNSLEYEEMCTLFTHQVKNITAAIKRIAQELKKAA